LAWTPPALPTGLPLPDDDGPLVSYRARVMSTSEVVAIDRERRLLTLREQDEFFEVVADIRLGDLADVRVGDMVEVHLTQALVLSLQPGTGIRERTTRSARSDPSAPGEPPSGRDEFEASIVVDVISVDVVGRHLVVRDEAARRRTLTILDEDVVGTARPGDQLVMRYRRATALEVRRRSPTP
jgi:hypothetical protein